MAIHLSVLKFIEMIGHDGSAEPYEDFPGLKAGFHEQECIEVLQWRGFSCTPIEIVPQMTPAPGVPVRPVWFPPGHSSEDGNRQRFICHLRESRGVITGMKKYINNDKMIGHSVAWDGMIYDPQGKGFVYTLEQMGDYGFMPRVYWKVQEI
jgi:hypothetical protein